MIMNRKFLVSVVGGHKCDEAVGELAEKIGEIIAGSGAVLVCGGLGGIMERAAIGAKKNGGLTIGIIPGNKKDNANEYVDIVIPSDMGYSRNTLVAGTGDMVIALPGEYGTLSEISFALIDKKPVYGFGTWDIPGVRQLSEVEELGKILEETM
jgi:uncharacterized protein (TIGR00725 family)